MNDSESISQKIEDGEVGLVEFQDFTYKKPFQFESGGEIPEFTLRYEAYGKLNKAKDNAILICHALTGDHHCAGVNNINERKSGWWNFMVGPGKPIDTSRYFVICSNVLGGCQGSTGPNSINPNTNKPYHLDFPKLTLRDMVKAQSKLIDYFGIEQLHAVIGGSMGGMLTLQWAKDFPNRLNRYIALASGAKHTAQTIAFNETGRQAIMRDPNWNQGNYSIDKGPIEGLSIARMMAHITYLSDVGLENKFGRKLRQSEMAKEQFDVEFEVESYLHYQGKSFVSRFDANSYLYLTKALDRFDFYEGQDPKIIIDKIKAKGLVVGFDSDWLYPPEGNRGLVENLLKCGKEASYAELSMDYGHDSFLMRSPDLYQLIQTYLNF